MSGFTAKYAIPTLAASDPVGNAPTVMAALANRVDLLLGESGVWTPTLVAATAASQAITLSRTYPGSTTADPKGCVIVEQHGGGVGGGTVINTWITNWLGSATTITGFTLNAICSSAGARTFVWRFLPVL